MKKLLPLLILLLCAALLLASCKKKPPEEPTTTAPETSAYTPPTELTTEATTAQETEPPATTRMETTGEPMSYDEDAPRREQATPSEIRAEEKRVQNALNTLKAGRIDKIVLVQTRPTAAGAERVTYESTSPEVIAAWTDIFGAMELSGAQFEFLSGGNLSVYAYTGDEVIELGCLEGNYLTNGALKTMCRIDNYADLYEDIRGAAALVSGDIMI